MKIVCISDTHRAFNQIKIPEADVFIHAGDIDCYEFLSEAETFNTWLGTLPCKHKIVIAGNHDGFLEKNPVKEIQRILSNCIYLENSGVTIDGVNFWGSPNTPIFNSWYFMMDSESLKKNWDKIPENTDVLITHGPPMDILDYVEIGRRHVGCPYLARRIQDIAPKVHIFGHIHGQHGIQKEMNINYKHYMKETFYINASVMDEWYDVANKPTTFFYYKELDELII